MPRTARCPLESSDRPRARALGVGLALAMGLAAAAGPAWAADTPEKTPSASDDHAVRSKLDATLYGFVELDLIGDTTQSFRERAGNTLVQRPGSYGGDHGRFMVSARHSRLGLKLEGPEGGSVTTDLLVEADFLGNQPPSPPLTEASFFESATFRLRHAWFKLQTPIVDVLIGQTWQLFGWGAAFQPNTVEIQGAPGEIYARAGQLRLSHVFSLGGFDLELALAAARPPQDDAFVPDGQAGVKLSHESWSGVHTPGATHTEEQALALGVSGVVRRFAVPAFTADPTSGVVEVGWGVSIDAVLPVIPASNDQRGNALTINGSFVIGTGIADLYTTLDGGATDPALPNPMMVSPAPTYTTDIDPGLVVFDSDGVARTINWRSYLFGLQYYLPPSGKLWIAANTSWIESDNIADSGDPSELVESARWADGNLFWEFASSARVGLEYAWFRQTYADGVEATNHRFQLSFFYVF
jgi:hypothetical protein